MLKKSFFPCWPILNIFCYVMLSTFLIVPISYSAVDNLSLERISVDNGLSQGSILSMAQDNTGFLWLGTENGINVYDGNIIRQLPGPDNTFENVAIHHVIEDKKGLIWLNVDGRGLYNYDPVTGKYQHISTNTMQGSDYYITDLINDVDNNIWVLTSKTLGVYNQTSKEFKQVINLSSELSGSLTTYKLSLHDGIIYIGAKVGTFAYDINANTWKKLPSIKAMNNKQSDSSDLDKIYTVNVQNNKLYLGSADGFYILDITHIKKYISENSPLPHYKKLIDNMASWDTLLDGDMLYIASDKGLYVTNTLTNNSQFLFGFSHYFNNITDDNIVSLIKDNHGVFWLGSKALGVYQWDPKKELVKNYSYRKDNLASLSDNEVWFTLPDNYQDNLLWVATSNGLNLIDLVGKNVTSFLENHNSKNIYTKSHIYSLISLSPKELLLSTAKGVMLFDSQIKKIIPLPFSDEVNKLLALEQLDIFKEDHFLWVSNNQGIFRIDLRSNQIDIINYAPDTNGSVFYLLGSLPNSDWFLLTSNDALWGVDTKTHQIVKLYQLEGTLLEKSSYIDNWTLDKNQILWLSFSGKGLIGLTLPDFHEKYFYHKANSIIENNVYGLMTDKDGDIWFSRHNGIFMLNSDNQHLSHFTRKNGLGATEFNANAYAELANGFFVYGSMEGVSIFDPLALKKIYDEKVSVKITAVQLLSRKLIVPLVVENNAVINLNYDDVGIRIDFSTFSYGYEDKIIYKYHLTGENNIEYPADSEAHITFPNLSSGRHTLSIQAKSPYTGQYSDPIKINFNVGYAPWFTPIAIFLYVMTTMLAIVVWYRYRTAQQQLLIGAYEQVKQREKRLQLALTGSNSEVWDWQADNNLLFGKRVALDLGYKEKALFYNLNEHVALIHPEDQESFLHSWQLFIKNASLTDNFSCTYRLRSSSGKWLWYKDLGKIVAVDQHNNPVRVTGSYTDITKSRAEEELAQYYGDAFQQTQDWVFIIDEKISKITANQAMRDVFNWSEEEFDLNNQSLRFSQERREFYHKLLLSLKVGEHWRGEESIIVADKGEYHVIVNITVSFSAVTNAVHYLFVLTDISAQKHAESELRYLANYDHLTGLPNRTLLLDRIKQAIDLSNRHNTSIAILFIDIDRFKQVNDSLGHDFGDLLLKKITKRLEDTLDLDGTIARIGGDEFVILLDKFEHEKDIEILADKTIEKINQSFDLNGHLVNVGASIGIALYPNNAINSDELLRYADVAMYHAKQAGKGHYKFYTAQMNIDAMERLSKESSLKLAVKNNEFINYYQPIVDAYTEKAVGVEMLMRWKKTVGMMQPNDFIPLSEELNLIITMTEMAMERVCQDLKVWHMHDPDFYVSINLAVQHFVEADIVSYIRDLLTRYQLPAKTLRLEVTESSLISQPENAITTMSQLTALGVTLALDDFGTGFSSLSYLKRLPLDIIKIDSSFVAGIGINDADEAIVDTTLVLAERLNMHCIAEGVETQAQLNYLLEKDCHYIQGYLYSKPLSAACILQNMLQENPYSIERDNVEIDH